jgi:predicted enzyme related to lactoylglutathione lyase
MAAKVIHVEVTGKNGPALQSFYSKIFDWELNTDLPDGYGMMRQDNGITGGIGPTRDGSAGNVTFYVHSEDPAGILRRVEELGGKVIMPLTEVAKDTTVALFADPEGHVVGIM